jgi:hypothetical protein
MPWRKERWLRFLDMAARSRVAGGRRTVGFRVEFMKSRRTRRDKNRFWNNDRGGAGLAGVGSGKSCGWSLSLKELAQALRWI